jgi:hypothetical protein
MAERCEPRSPRRDLVLPVILVAADDIMVADDGLDEGQT